MSLGDKKWTAVAVAVGLALGACAGGGSHTKSAYGDLPTTASVVTTARSGSTLASPRSITSLRGRPVSVAPRSATAVASADPVADASVRGPGDFAGFLLGPGSVKSIVYELMLERDLAPRQHTLDHVVGELRTYSGKPSVIQRTAVPGGPSAWTADAMNTFVSRYTRFASGGDRAVLHVVFVHGSMPGAAAVTTRADVIAVFPDVYKGGGLTASDAQIEDVVVMHETGHILGLVDLWLNDGRGDFKDDPAPGGHHSPNPDSVMYWRVETLDVKSFFRGGPPSEFDADDQRDLRAIHNGAPKGGKA